VRAVPDVSLGLEVRDARPAGFTIVEVMAVLAMMVVVSFLAVRLMSRGRRAEAAPAFARNLLTTLHQARQTALASARATRVTIAPPVGTAPSTVTSEMQQLDGTWVILGGTQNAPQGLELCDPEQTTSITTAAPICPATKTTEITFAKNGPCRQFFACVTALNGAAIPTPLGGTTVYFRSIDDAKHYKLPVFSLTGLPKVVDRW
jgi:Tfp pilus assembly protein FimT